MYKTKPGVYRMFNIVTNNSYVGSSKNISMRISSHGTRLKSGYKDNAKIKKDLKDHGIESFKFELLEYCDESIMKNREQYYFELLKPNYNAWPTVFNAAGRSYTDEQLKSFQGREHVVKDKKSMSEKMKLAWIHRKKTPEFKELLKKLKEINTGKVPSDQTRERMSLSGQGRPKTAEFKEMMRRARLGTKWDPVNRKWIKN